MVLAGSELYCVHLPALTWWSRTFTQGLKRISEIHRDFFPVDFTGKNIPGDLGEGTDRIVITVTKKIVVRYT